MGLSLLVVDIAVCLELPLDGEPTSILIGISLLFTETSLRSGLLDVDLLRCVIRFSTLLEEASLRSGLLDLEFSCLLTGLSLLWTMSFLILEETPFCS